MAISPLALSLAYQQPITQPPHANVAPTDVLGAYNLSTNAANQQYLAKLQQQNAMWGGLAGLGGAGLQAYMLRGSGLFGGGTPAAGGAISTGTPVANAAGDITGYLGVGPTAAGLPAASSVFDTGAAGVPLAGLDASSIGADAAAPAVWDLTGAAGAGALDAGTTVGADLAATGAADALGAGAADAGAMTLADLLPFLFMA